MKFIDFFSGIGGFRLGMEMAGHECVGHCEIDKYADKSYRAMHEVKDGEWYANDITRIEPGDLPDAECYCGGFPCQAFSIAGNRRGFEDTRGTLFFEVMRLAQVRQPKFLFLENVKGLLSHDGGRTFGTILQTLWECGYDAEWQVLNSKYWVPQNRERIFIVGHLRSRGGFQVFPITEGNGKVDVIQGQTTNTITARYGNAYGQGNFIVENKLDAQVKQINNLDNWQGSTRQSDRVYSVDGISPTLDRHGVIVENPKIVDAIYNSRKPREYTEVAPTLRADRQGLEVHKGMAIRKLTPRECFRLQGFPDEYFDRAAQVNSDSQIYKQAGNSVTVPVIYEIARRLM